MKLSIAAAAVLVAVSSPAFAQCTSGGSSGASNAQARGINIYADNLLQQGAQPVLNTFPGINSLRVNVFDLNADSAAALAPVVNQLTSHGVVVELEDHNYPTVLTGGDLQNAAAWYASLAQTFKGNPNVIFGTQNEPDLSSGWGAVSTEISTIYNAIRSTGNQSLILMNPAGGYTTSGFDPSTFASMTNVAWDLHFYNWMANNSTDLQANINALNNEVSGAKATANIPVTIGEYGISSGADGAVNDPGGIQVTQAVQQSGLSSDAWAWTSGNPTFPLLLNDPGGDPSQGLTQFGQMTQQFLIGASAQACSATTAATSVSSISGTISQAPAPVTSSATSCIAANAITPGNGSFSGNGGTYAVDASNGDVATVNGVPINSGAYETSQLTLGSDGNIYGQSNASFNNGQWFQLVTDNAGGSSWLPLDTEPSEILPTNALSSSCSDQPNTGAITNPRPVDASNPAAQISTAQAAPDLAAVQAQIQEVQGQINQLQSQVNSASPPPPASSSTPGPDRHVIVRSGRKRIMIRRAIFGIGSVTAAIAVWVVAASYTFVLLIGAREKWTNHDVPITGFYHRLVANDYAPWLAYWIFWGTPNPNVRSMLIAGAFLPLIAVGLVALIVWRIIVISRLRPRLIRRPWDGDTPSRPTNAA